MVNLISTYVKEASLAQSKRATKHPRDMVLPFYTLEERQKAILKERVQTSIKSYLTQKEDLFYKEIDSPVSDFNPQIPIEQQDFVPQASPFENSPLSYLEMQITLKLSEILKTLQGEYDGYLSSMAEFLSGSLQESFSFGFRPPKEHEYQINPGGTINLVNQDTGETTTLTIDDSGNLKQGFGRILEAETITLSSQDVLHLGGVHLRGEGSKESYRIEVSREGDWIIEAEGRSKETHYYIDEVQHGLDVVNLINIKTGAVAAFKIGCLEQYDRVIATGDDVSSFKVRPGDVIHIKSAGEHGDYLIEASTSGEWLVRPEKREGEDQSVFYRSKDMDEGDVINLKDTNIEEVVSFQVNKEGSLVQLEKKSFKGNEATTYEFAPNDKILIQTKAGRYYHISLLEGEGWQIKGLPTI
ncbi:MAG: hypothetical protein QME81_02110 [bacterium]|nr:hypothetical protein [bacterium]